MNYIIAIFLFVNLFTEEYVMGSKRREDVKDTDMYEYDTLTSSWRLKFVKEVVDDHHIKDISMIKDCGPDQTQNWYEPDPEDCSCYFVCTGKFYVHRRCSHGLMFDPHSEQCNWPEEVDCRDRPMPWIIPDYQGPATQYFSEPVM